MTSLPPRPTAGAEVVTFGDFELDLRSGELRRDGRVVPLRPLATRGLLLLVRRAGRLVTMEDLRRELWGATVVDWNAGIHQAIRQIRLALGDDARAAIETVTRQGYRFRLPVRPVRSAHRPASAARRSLRSYAAGFATSVALMAAFFIWCGTLS